MVAAGLAAETEIKEGLRNLLGQSESGGGVFHVTDYEIVFLAVLLLMFQELFYANSSRLAIDISDKK